MSTIERFSMDTNGGANTFTWDGTNLFVSGHSIGGSYELTDRGDMSQFLVTLFGGTLLRNGDLAAAADGRTAANTSASLLTISTTAAEVGRTYDVFGGNLNLGAFDAVTNRGGFRDVGDAKIAAVLDTGARFVNGPSERIGFDSVADAQNFLGFMQWAASKGVLDDIM